MSNKIVPQIYRAIIDDVISNVAVDFEEYGMEDLLPMLQSKWEAKLLETRVAEFARAPDAPGGDSASSHAPPAQPPATTNGAQASDGVHVKAEPDDALRLRGGAAEDVKPVIPADGTSGPVPMPPARPEPNANGLRPGDEVIDSDLDDSDDELGDDDDGEDGDGEIDIVFCVYDKVQRVKNKWKTVFKDGLIHINGKDYLFAKCQGEFEW